MSQVLFDAPYFSQSQGVIDEHLSSKIEPFDQAIAEEIFLKQAGKVSYDRPTILETDSQRFEQGYIEESSIVYCNQYWVEQAGGDIKVIDKKTGDERVLLEMPESLPKTDRMVRQALVAHNKLFALTTSDRVLVWDLTLGTFIEKIALPHEHIQDIAHTGQKLLLKTSKRYMAAS
jgi:hypothetical protein